MLGGELGVLGGPGVAQLAVGPGLFGPVAGGLAARLYELGMGDPGGRGTEHDPEDRSSADEEQRAAEDGTRNHERRDNEQSDGGDEADAALPRRAWGEAMGSG